MRNADRSLGGTYPSPIYDPYLALPGPQAQLHPGSVDHCGVEPSRSGAPRRQRLALVVAIAALVTALASATLLGWGAYRWHQVTAQMAADESSEDESATKRVALEAEDEDADEDADDDATDALQRTTTVQEGAIEVVDLGVTGDELADGLRLQALFAKAKEQRLLVMLSGRRCAPCRGFDEALSHPLMQDALRDVRLVRIDLDAFGEELRQLDIPTGLYPAFFLLDEGLRPIDAIHGGEWDADIPENIAPVLGRFLRGEYRERRHHWSPTSSSIRI